VEQWVAGFASVHGRAGRCRLKIAPADSSCFQIIRQYYRLGLLSSDFFSYHLPENNTAESITAVFCRRLCDEDDDLSEVTVEGVPSQVG